jgi:G patch domain-containing protein 1
MIGTPFKTDDEKLQRKVNKINKKPWEQEVRDEKGRRRFHGAFTGGFSSGYFNTAGSKEGWNPSNFISSKSRDKVNKSEQQTVLDFMDEEDIQEQVGAQRITSKEGYKDFIHQEIRENEKSKSIIPGSEAIYAEILPQHNNAIGNKLMIVAGFDEMKRKTKNGDDLEKDIFHQKYYRGRLDFKDDYYGYGYVPGHEEVIQKKEKETSNPNKIHMDRFEEDYRSGFFNSNDISGYNFEEVEDNFDYKKHMKNDMSKIRQTVKFVKSNHKLQTTHQINFELPKLPKEYDPFKLIENKSAEVDNKQRNEKSHYRMNPEKRSQILNADDGEGNKYFTNKFIKAEDKIKYKIEFKEATGHSENSYHNNIKPPSSTDQIESVFNFKIDIPFKNDVSKVSRFAKFIAEKEGLIIGDSYHSHGGSLTTASQIREERIFFEKLYEDEQKLKQAEKALKTEIRKQTDTTSSKTEDEIPKKENDIVKREKTKWQPDKILCKRFKVKDPYENVVNTKDEKISKNLNELQKEIFKEEARIHNYSQHHHYNPNNPDLNLKMTNNEKNSFIIINAKPDLNLFEEIFGD